MHVLKPSTVLNIRRVNESAKRREYIGRSGVRCGVI